MKAEKKTYLELGSYSSCTMRAEDLIPCFESVLESCGVDLSEYDKGGSLQPEYKTGLPPYDDDEALERYWDSEDSGYYLEWLFDSLQEFCPPYTYFGANPGDGADYGVWILEDFPSKYDSELLNLDCEDQEKNESLADFVKRKEIDLSDIDYVYVGNDGLGTLYDAKDLVEIWSV